MKRNTAVRHDFHADDGGFTTVGMVLALLISLSLIFSAGKVYRINSMASSLQHTADAAALAAENQVAQFYIIATVCDAVVLSMSLTSVVLFGLGAAALCTPVTAAASETLLKAGADLLKARNSFARKAADGLDRLQSLLPFLAAANAAVVIAANNDKTQHTCFGLAVLLPTEGEAVQVGAADAADRLAEEVQAEKESISQAGQQAEQAAKEADEHKRRAFMADCGNNPGYCMYQRAATLAGMGGAENPLYSSVDTWSFSVALRRAQVYYPRRLQSETPLGTSVDELSNSALRKVFYRYACEMVRTGYVHEQQAGAFDANFPLLPCNTQEMRQTSLYTDPLYPISTVDDKQTMHAWSGCPELAAKGQSGTGSIESMEKGGFETCPQCSFAASSLGKVAAASTSIDNGFEYHYQIVAREAKAYQTSIEKYRPQAQQVKEGMQKILDKASDALRQAVSARIKVLPPGRYGCVAMVASTTGVDIGSIMPSTFVSGKGTLGASAAISAATLAQDSADETGSVIASLLDGVRQESDSLGIAGGSLVLDLWSKLLSVYQQGSDSLTESVRNAIDAIPFASASGLGTWAAEAFSAAVQDVGMEPVDLSAPKPVIVNSSWVLGKDDGTFSSALLQVKTGYAQMGGQGTGSLFDAAISAAQDSIDSRIDAADTFVVTEISLGGEGAPSIPITITLPPAVTQGGKGLVAAATDSLRQVIAQNGGAKRWE